MHKNIMPWREPAWSPRRLSQTRGTRFPENDSKEVILLRHVKWMNIALSTALAVCLAVPAYAAGAPEESAPVQEETAAA